MTDDKGGGTSVKFLFLDIDGVLNSFEYLKGRQEDWAEVQARTDMTDFEKEVYHCKHDVYRDRVEMLDVLEPLGVKIILSSTWRMCQYEEIIEIFKQWSQLRIVGATTYRRLTTGYEMEKRTGRGLQIQSFMDDYHRPVTELNEWDEPGLGQKYGPIDCFAILDDDADMDNIKEHLVKVDGRIGLQQEHVDKLIEVFK